MAGPRTFSRCLMGRQVTSSYRFIMVIPAATGRVAQLVRAPASHAGGLGFESPRAHHTFSIAYRCH